MDICAGPEREWPCRGFLIPVCAWVTWHVTRDTWHVTQDTWEMTPDTWHVTHDTRHLRAKKNFFYHFSLSGNTKTNFNAHYWLLLLDQKSSFFHYVLLDTEVNKIWREKGTKQIKILVLVLPELGFWCFRKAQKYFKTGNCIGSKIYLVNFLHWAY